MLSFVSFFFSIFKTVSSLNAEGITAVELDDQDQYFVGLGGLPNADGEMELDAAVMDGKTMSYGAVMAIRQGFEISVSLAV